MSKDNILPQTIYKAIAEISAKAGIEAYKEEQKKSEKNKKAQNVKDTKRQLAAYRQIKRQLREEKTFTYEEEQEYRWKCIKDLMENSYVGKSDRIIDDEEKRRQESMYTIYRLENAMKMYKEEVDLSCNGEDKRRYRELYDLHIADQAMSIPELAIREEVSTKTVYRDIGIAYRIVAFYLYGI